MPCHSLLAQVDKYVKEVAWKVFQTGFTGYVPGLIKNGRLNTNIPLGGLLRLSFHDAGKLHDCMCMWMGQGGLVGATR